MNNQSTPVWLVGRRHERVAPPAVAAIRSGVPTSIRSGAGHEPRPSRGLHHLLGRAPALVVALATSAVAGIWLAPPVAAVPQTMQRSATSATNSVGDKAATVTCPRGTK